MAHADAADAGKKIAEQLAGLTEDEIVRAIRIALVVVGLDEKLELIGKRSVSDGR